MFTKTAQYIARSPLKNIIYPVADTILNSFGQVKAKRYNINRTILVVCPGRSGSTWLAETIAALHGYIILWEPLHLENNPESKANGFGWQNYFYTGGSYKKQKEYLEKVYTGQKLSTRTLTSLEFQPSELINFRGYVVKHVNANMILPYIMEWFPIRAVLMIRHPCAVVASQLKHGSWTDINKENITIPDGLFTDYPHIESVFEKLTSLEELLAFEWAIQTYIPLSHPTPHPWYLTTYERLVVGGKEEAKRIFEFINEPMPKSIERDLKSPSATTQKESHVQQGKNRLTGWTKQLDSNQVEDVLRTTHDVGVHCYNEDLIPDESQLPLADGQPTLF